MNWNLFWIFVVLNVVNVIIQTIKSIATVKCGKGAAAIINAIAYGLYTIVTVYMLCELPLIWKAGIVALCNLIGVYVVKWCEEKARKDKLWKVEATIPNCHTDELHYDLKAKGIPHNFIEGIGQYTVFNIYCETQKESATAKVMLDKYKAKYFVSESKTL
jgi:uncharacterized protein YebE (UPF0316 family)